MALTKIIQTVKKIPFFKRKNKPLFLAIENFIEKLKYFFFIYYYYKDINEQNSDLSSNINFLNKINSCNNNINKNTNSKEKQEKNQLIRNGNYDENRNKNTFTKSYNESPQFFNKKKTNTNLNSDKDETFSNIIKFANQDPRGSFGQINPLKNFFYKVNSGNTYSSIHKDNISYNSVKNHNNENKNGKKPNKFSNNNQKSSFSKSIFLKIN